MGKTDRYHQAYNKKHRKRLLALKKDRYKKDPEYRLAAKKRAAKRREMLRKQAGGPGRVQRRNAQGTMIWCTRVGQVAKMLGVKWEDIAKLEREGVIPKPIYGKYRVYDDHQKELLKKVVKALKTNESPSKLNKVRAILHSTWKDEYLGGV